MYIVLDRPVDSIVKPFHIDCNGLQTRLDRSPATLSSTGSVPVAAPGSAVDVPFVATNDFDPAAFPPDLLSPTHAGGVSAEPMVCTAGVRNLDGTTPVVLICEECYSTLSKRRMPGLTLRNS